LAREERLVAGGPRLAAALAISLLAPAFFPAQAQPFDRDDPRAKLIIALSLVDAQRKALHSSALPFYSPGGKHPGLKACIDSKATDARMEADLAAALKPSLSSREGAQPLLAFLETAAGKKLAAGVARRDRVASDLRRVPGRRPMTIAGVILFSDEVSEPEARQIDGFVQSDAGRPLRGTLAETTGFAHLTRTIRQMRTMATECGIDLK
jgi:hypothetical protein